MKCLAAILAATTLAASAGVASAQYQRPDSFDAPNNRDFLAQQDAEELSYLRLAQVGTDIPLDLTFTDETGKEVKFGDYFDGTTPVILQLGYYECPQLCTEISKGIADAVKNLTLEDGEYRILTVSFDPNEKYTLGAAKKTTTLDAVGRPEVFDDWHFLVGTQDNIDVLTESVGFGYGWVELAQEWSHPSVIFILSPSGKLTRSIPGVDFDPQTVRLSLVEAADGRVGTFLDKIALITCFSYDAGMGQYTPSAVKLMRSAALLTVVLMGVVIAYWLFREKRVRTEDNAEKDPKDTGTPATA
ncbi:MAG: SCO family protein [Planctomycetota bacterium]